MADRINFSKKLNSSLQVGDELFHGNNPPVSLGSIINIGENFVEVDSIGSATASDFFSFKKSQFNKSSLKGYFAKVKMSTDSPQKNELFALASEVTLSSK